MKTFFASIILISLLSGCGQVPTAENIEAFRKGARGKVTFDLNGLKGTRFDAIFKSIESKADIVLHSDCFKQRLIELNAPTDIFQSGLGLPVDFIKREIHSLSDVHRYAFSQSVEVYIAVDHLDGGQAQANFDGITFDESAIADGEKYLIASTIHEIMHVIGFGHISEKTDLRFMSVPYRAGSAAFFCSLGV